MSSTINGIRSDSNCLRLKTRHRDTKTGHQRPVENQQLMRLGSLQQKQNPDCDGSSTGSIIQSERRNNETTKTHPLAADIICSAWEDHAPNATFAGMTLAQFKTVTKPSKARLPITR